MSGETYEVPEGFFYTKDHEWVKKSSEESILIGITDYAAKMLHDIVYVTLPDSGARLLAKQVLGQVESVKTVSDIYMPISGTVLKTNDRLTREPEIVSDSPYSEGWMVELEANDYDEEVKGLLTPDSYRKYIQDLISEESH